MVTDAQNDLKEVTQLARAEAAPQALITEAIEVATQIAREYRQEMDRLVERLLDEETLTSEQIAEILGPAPVTDDALPSDAITRVASTRVWQDMPDSRR